LKPSLEIRERPVGAREDHLAVLRAPALGDRSVGEAEAGERRGTVPAVCVYDGALGHVVGDEAAERVPRGVRDGGEAKPSRTLSANLDRNHHEPLSNAVAAAPALRIAAADQTLVHLHFAAQRLTLRRDHRPAKLLEDEPSRLGAPQDDDHRSHGPAMGVIGSMAHYRHDLLHRGRVGRVEHAVVARRAAGVVTGERRRRATAPSRVEHGQHGHGSSSQETADTGAALHGSRSPGYRSPCETERLSEPRIGASRRQVFVREVVSCASK
jgi:hypothetical protein